MSGPRDLFAQLRTLEIVSAHLADLALVGTYRSSFKGQGLSFQEVRPYQPGDDVRSIDWNVSARQNDTFVKVFAEERELSIMLAVDTSASAFFGTQRTAKDSVACEVAAMLAMSAIRNNDCVGLVAGGADVRHVIRPRKGRKHALRIVTELFYDAHRSPDARRAEGAPPAANAQPRDIRPERGARTALAALLDAMGRVANRRSVVFVVSDFYADAYEASLGRLARRHDVIPIWLTDPRDRELPDLGVVTFEDLESGEPMLVDTGDSAVRAYYRDRARALEEEIRATFRRLRLDHVALSTEGSYVDPLRALFSRRARRRGTR